MVLMNRESGYALKVSDQVHIHLPSSAFTNEATNFWVGAFVGIGLMAAFIAALTNQ